MHMDEISRENIFFFFTACHSLNGDMNIILFINEYQMIMLLNFSRINLLFSVWIVRAQRSNDNSV